MSRRTDRHAEPRTAQPRPQGARPTEKAPEGERKAADEPADEPAEARWSLKVTPLAREVDESGGH